MPASTTLLPHDTLQTSPADLRSALEELDHLLNTSREADAIIAARLAVADTLARLAVPIARGPLTDALLSAADLLSAHPAGTLPTPADHPLPTRNGWTASLQHLFAAPAWQTSDLRPLSDQPVWLWPSYARYLFASPASFENEATETRWAAHLLHQLAHLVRILEANPGSAIASTLARQIVEISPTWPASDGRHLRARRHHLGRLLTLLAPRLTSSPLATLPADDGAPLRVALLGDGLPPLKALLDPERIQLTHYSERDLPPDLPSLVADLRQARYHAILFADDITQPDTPVARLALHRLAPLQLATALCPHTTGLATIDIFLGDSTYSPEHHTERLATLPAALAFDPPPPFEETAPTRADLGLPETASLLVTTLHPAYARASDHGRWARLLESDPIARLILIPGSSGHAMDRLLADYQHHYGDRVIIAGQSPLEPAALHALLGVCDAYLPSQGAHDRLACELAHRLGLRIPDAPPRIDTLGFAETLSNLLETACRSPHSPLQTPTQSWDPASRREQAQNLLALGRADRAVLYLLAAVDDPEAGPETWHDLALALHANNQHSEALQALETCVRHAPDRVDSWLLLSDWATACGREDLAAEIDEVLRGLAARPA